MSALPTPDPEQQGIHDTLEIIDVLASIDAAMEILGEIPETPEWEAVHTAGNLLSDFLDYRLARWNWEAMGYPGREKIFRCSQADSEYPKCERFTTNGGSEPICDECGERMGLW